MIAPETLAKPRPSAPPDQAPCLPALPGEEAPGSIRNSGGWSLFTEVLPSSNCPSIKDVCARATPPTWGWGAGAAANTAPQ